MPAAAWTVNRYTAQVMGVLFGTHPIVTVTGRRRVDDQFKDAIEQFLEGLCTETFSLEDAWDPAVSDSLRVGSAILHYDYQRIIRTVKRHAQTNAGWEVQEQDAVVYDGPSVEFIPIERVGVYPATAKDFESALGVYIDDTIYGEDLVALHDQGIIDTEALEALKKAGSDNNLTTDKYVHNLRGIAESTSAGSRLELTPGDTNFNYWPFRIYKVYWRLALDERSPSQDWIIWLHPETDTIIHARPNDAFDQRRRLVLLRPFPDAEGIYGDSLAGMCEDVQMAMTAILRQVIDEASISINTPLAMPTVNEIEGEDYTIAPGKVWRVNSSNGIIPIAKPSPNNIGLPLLQYLLSVVERVTGVSDNQMGMSSDRTTATEAQVKENNASTLFNLVVNRYRSGLNQGADHLLSLCYEYAGNESVRALWDDLVGPDIENPFEMSVDAMGGKYKFNANGTTASTSRALRQALMREVYERLLANPLVQANPLRLFAVTRRYLMELGFRVPEEMIGKEEEIKAAMADQAQAQQALMDQDQMDQQNMMAAQQQQADMDQAPDVVAGAIKEAIGASA